MAEAPAALMPSSFLMTPAGQTSILGLIFLFIFAAYMTIQGFATQLYGDVLASNMESTLYGTFTLSCFFAPAVTNKLGARLTLFLGSLGYATLVAASLLLAVVGEPWCRPFVVLGGGVLGIGAALLWTAQGRLMCEWSDGSDQGKLFAIFWALFNCSAVFGGLLTAFYFSHNSEAAPWPLYLIFLGCIVGGGAATGLLAPAHKVVRRPPATVAAVLSTAVAARQPQTVPDSTTTSVNGTSASADAESAGATASAACGGASGAVEASGAVDASNWAHEAMCTLRLFGTRRMAVLAPLFWYTGFNQPYQLNTFGNRYFDGQALGVQLASFYLAEIVGGFLAGWMLDRETNPRIGALRQLLVFVAVTAGGYAFATSSELPAALHSWPNGNVTRLSLDDPAILAPSAAFALWGLSDSQVQGYSYWLIRQLHEEGDELARAVGFYKMVQSLGWSVGFLLVPTSRLPPIVQLTLTGACALIGAALALLELPAPRKLGARGHAEPLLS